MLIQVSLIILFHPPPQNLFKSNQYLNCDSIISYYPYVMQFNTTGEAKYYIFFIQPTVSEQIFKTFPLISIIISLCPIEVIGSKH